MLAFCQLAGGRDPSLHLKSPRALPAAPCSVSAEDAFSKRSRAVHASELRLAWPPGLPWCCRAGWSPKPLHGFPVRGSRHRCELCGDSTRPLLTESPVLSPSLLGSASTKPSHSPPAPLAIALLTDHLDLFPTPHLAGSKGPHVSSADEVWEAGLGWYLLPHSPVRTS